MAQPEFIIITGLSGAGKSLALKYFEDQGFFCVDNLLPALLSKFAELCAHSDVKRVALVMDTRGQEFFSTLLKDLQELSRNGFRYQIVFLDSSDEVLVRRFSESRRKHPLAPTGRPLEGIKAERLLLEEIKGVSDKIIDTNILSPQEFRDEIISLFMSKREDPINITVVSFGYKYGIPLDSDLVFDVRFLPNPYYVENLRDLTGNNEAVRDFVLGNSQAGDFLSKLFDLHRFLIPLFVGEGKAHLTIAIGCTGGKHRSVAISNELARYLESLNYPLHLEHRDLKK
ncbi:MAG: RNase adapter RapZ [bacterium]